MVSIDNLTAHQFCNGSFGLYIGFVADGIGQICLSTVTPDGAAICLGGVALLFQLVQVPADGFFGHTVVCRQLAYQYPLFQPQFIENLVFSFDCKHMVPPYPVRIEFPQIGLFFSLYPVFFKNQVLCWITLF